MSSLICKIFGHKWREFIVTGYDYNNVGISGIPRELGYTRELTFCKRCGELNPATKDFVS